MKKKFIRLGVALWIKIKYSINSYNVIYRISNNGATNSSNQNDRVLFGQFNKFSNCLSFCFSTSSSNNKIISFIIPNFEYDKKWYKIIFSIKKLFEGIF